MSRVLSNGPRGLLRLLVVGLLMPACAGAPADHGPMAAAPREVLRIKAFGVNQYGESLFCPNSEKWRTKNPA